MPTHFPSTNPGPIEQQVPIAIYPSHTYVCSDENYTHFPHPSLPTPTILDPICVRVTIPVPLMSWEDVYLQKMYFRPSWSTPILEDHSQLPICIPNYLHSSLFFTYSYPSALPQVCPHNVRFLCAKNTRTKRVIEIFFEIHLYVMPDNEVQCVYYAVQ